VKLRVLLLVAAVAALIGLGVLARAWFAPETAAGDKVFAGSYTSDTDLRITNLTIAGGHIRVGYSFDVLFESPEPATLRCGLVDTSGRLDFFESSRQNAPSGAWTHVEFASNYDLPELTLGIRCSPSVDGVMSIAFRDIVLSVGPAD